MKSRFAALVVLLAALSLARVTAAQPVSVAPGQVYPGGTRVGFPTLGLSFRLPKQFKGSLSDQGFFLMASDTQPGVIIGVSDDNQTVATLAQQLSQPIPLDAATVLTPVGRAKRKGSTVNNRYTVTANGQKLVGHARARLFGGGVGVAFISVGPDGRAAKHRLDAVFKSIRKLPKPKAGASSGPWAQRLRGNTLLYMKTANGLSTKKSIQLCQNGRFVYSGSDSYLSGGFSGVGRGNDGGAYSIQGATLILRWSDGSVQRRALSSQGAKTFVDGVRWFFQRGTTSCP